MYVDPQHPPLHLDDVAGPLFSFSQHTPDKNGGVHVFCSTSTDISSETRNAMAAPATEHVAIYYTILVCVLFKAPSQSTLSSLSAGQIAGSLLCTRLRSTQYYVWCRGRTNQAELPFIRLRRHTSFLQWSRTRRKSQRSSRSLCSRPKNAAAAAVHLHICAFPVHCCMSPSGAGPPCLHRTMGWKSVTRMPSMAVSDTRFTSSFWADSVHNRTRLRMACSLRNPGLGRHQQRAPALGNRKCITLMGGPARIAWPRGGLVSIIPPHVVTYADKATAPNVPVYPCTHSGGACMHLLVYYTWHVRKRTEHAHVLFLLAGRQSRERVSILPAALRG